MQGKASMLGMTCMNCEQLQVGIACASSWVVSPLASPIVYVGTAAGVAMPAVSDTESLRDTQHHGGTQKQTPVWKPIVMQAKHQTPCSYCHLPISPGNAIYPWGDYTGYMHLHCALKEADGQGVELLPPVCKHWSRRGYCLYKEKCFYRHPPDALPDMPAVADVRNHNAMTNQAQRIGNRGVGRRNLVRNAFRAGVFRRFLIDTFGRELLNEGSGVLDVAGGKGELSFELLNLNGINATVVEPRALQLWRQHKWMLKGFYHRNVNFQSYVDHTHDEFVSGKQACVDPPHLRMVFDEAVVNSLLTPDSHQALSAPAPASQDHHQAANHGADAVVKQDKGQQLQSDHAQEAFGTAAQGGAAQQNPARLSDSLAGQSQQASDSSLDSAQLNVEPGDWQAVLQCSMQAARDIKWTHKGLQRQEGKLVRLSLVECLQHEDSQAWAEAETGETPQAAQQQQQDLQEAVAKCSISDSTEADDTAGATDVTDLDLARSIIQNCSVIVGIHPDQAAEPIINFAQRTKRPFAMVPCCVYPMEFPRRRLSDGTFVRKYEQLIQYLQSRDPEHIQVATLPFEGRNQVVYCKGWGTN